MRELTRLASARISTTDVPMVDRVRAAFAELAAEI